MDLQDGSINYFLQFNKRLFWLVLEHLSGPCWSRLWTYWTEEAEYEAAGEEEGRSSAEKIQDVQSYRDTWGNGGR